MKNGFKPVSWIIWDKGYEDHMIEQGWKPGIDKQESIIFYKYDPEGSKIYENTKPRYFTNRTIESKKTVDENGDTKYAYDVAYAESDKDIKK